MLHIVNTSDTDYPWWQTSVFYQIYMPSFQDSDGDGYSDFRGMANRLEYLQSLGIEGIWLTPFLKSPKVDNGYDIADYYQIDFTYGSMDDFKSFLTEAHARNMKVIMDMVLNHSSTDCYWFQEARKSKDNPYRDYYIWRDKPNNWESFFGGSAWEYDSLTNQYYYHKFDKKMADLNWNNPKLVDEMLQVLRFWLDLGVDGFRLDVINFLNTDGILEDNPIMNGKQIHLYDIDQPGLKNTLHKIRKTVDEYDNKFLVGEVGSDDIQVLKIYQSPEMMDVVFNFNFGSIPKFDIERIYHELTEMENQMPGIPTLFFGSHDNPRLMNRLADLDTQKALALHCLILTAKGVPFIYYGDEIGMQNIIANEPVEMIDIQAKTQYQLALDEGKTAKQAMQIANQNNRDRSRSPMQWNAESYAGFSTNTPWINVQEHYESINVEKQLEDPDSFLNKIKQLITLRNNNIALQIGEYSYLKLADSTLKYGRTYQGDTIHVVINFGDEKSFELPENHSILLGSELLKPNDYLIYRAK
ncbi:MAG: alpha-glucosidase [Bacteroidetes bacterium]|nr:alpha-glucosidase [Bacteroidota bacterium]